MNRATTFRLAILLGLIGLGAIAMFLGPLDLEESLESTVLEQLMQPHKGPVDGKIL